MNSGQKSPSLLLTRLRDHARERPDAVAYAIAGGDSLTYQALVGQVSALAQRLRRDVPRDAVVLLSYTNQLEYPVAFLGILAAGLTVFPVSTELADAELLRAATESNACAVIGDKRAVGLLAPSLGWAIRAERLPEGGAIDWDPQDWGNLLLQSSGTTGLPKIIRRTGASLDAVAGATAESVGFTARDRVLMTAPLTHSYGLEHGILAPLWAGSQIVLCRGLDMGTVTPQLSSGGITLFPGVPSTFEMLAEAASPHLIMPALRTAYSAGAPLPRAVYDAFLRRFGIRIAQLYGASEIGSVAFNAPGADFDPASVGTAMRGVSIRIVDFGAGNTALSAGREGQVLVRAASMFSGYINGPAELIDGHFATGDLGHVDARGRLFITGRIKLLIDIGGLKVNPLEVEAVLERHPAVGACVVIPIRQSQTVFRLKAIVTPRDPSITISVDELRLLARSQLAAYKIPRLFEVRESLPRSATGKILRHLVEKT